MVGLHQRPGGEAGPTKEIIHKTTDGIDDVASDPVSDWGGIFHNASAGNNDLLTGHCFWRGK